MAIESITRRNVRRQGVIHYAWENLDNGDQGEVLEAPDYPDKSVQVYGTFGASGSVNLEGTNDETALTDPGSAEWDILNDPQGNALTITTEKSEQVLENMRFYRANVTVGDGTTDLTIEIVGSRNE